MWLVGAKIPIKGSKIQVETYKDEPRRDFTKVHAVK